MLIYLISGEDDQSRPFSSCRRYLESLLFKATSVNRSELGHNEQAAAEAAGGLKVSPSEARESS